MAKVLMFPQKKRIPESIDDRLREVAKDYVEILKNLVDLLDIDISNDNEYEETLLMVQESFAKGIIEAIQNGEEG